MEKKTFFEEIKVLGYELADKVKALIHEGNVRRIIIKDEHGHTFVEIPVAVAAGVLIWFGIRPAVLNQPKTAIAAGYLVNRHAMFSPITPFADDAPIPAAFTSDDASH